MNSQTLAYSCVYRFTISFISFVNRPHKSKRKHTAADMKLNNLSTEATCMFGISVCVFTLWTWKKRTSWSDSKWRKYAITTSSSLNKWCFNWNIKGKRDNKRIFKTSIQGQLTGNNFYTLLTLPQRKLNCLVYNRLCYHSSELGPRSISGYCKEKWRNKVITVNVVDVRLTLTRSNKRKLLCCNCLKYKENLQFD